MRRRSFLGVLASTAVIQGSVFAQTGQKRNAYSGDSFLTGDIEYRLADIVAPSIIGFGEPESHAERSKEIMQALLNKGVDEIRELSEPDRWGRKIIVPSRFGAEGEKRSLQLSLIEAGAVRVHPQSNEEALIRTLLNAEEKARTEKTGLWCLPGYRVWSATKAGGAIGAYHLVEGVVVQAAARRDRTYLNFGADYKTDFTATLRSSLARRWRETGFDVLELEGEKVRIRGFVEAINGPSIELDHSQQIEILKP